MTDFDGSSNGADGTVALAKDPDDGGPVLDMSALEQLRSIVEEQQAEREPWVKVIAKGLIRITCDTVVDNPDYQRWMRAAMPKQQGQRRGSPDLTRMDQLVLTSRALLHCCTQVEVRNRKVKDPAGENAWVTVVGRTGETLRLDDDEMLSTFHTPDARALVSKVFGRDSDVIGAGMELLEACGYVPTDDDDGDPT